MPARAIITYAVVAAVAAALVGGCKYSNTYPPLPFAGPSLAPTINPAYVTEFPIPTANATPFGIAKGADGNMWFTELNGNRVGRVSPSGSISEVPLPAVNSLPEDIIQGPGGNPNIWFDETGNNKIGAINESTGQLVAEYPTGSGPSGLAADPTNNSVLWFAEFTSGKLGKISMNGIVTEYSIAGAYTGAQPDSVAVTADGRVWFLDFFNNAVGYLVPSTSFVHEDPIPTANSIPEFIVVGPDGNLWFTEGNTGLIGKYTPGANPPITEYVTPANSAIVPVPFGITVSPEDGDIWFAEVQAGQVGRVVPATGAITEYGIPGSGTTAVGVAAGPDVFGGAPNDLWFTDGSLSGIPPGTVGTNQVGKIALGLIPASKVRKVFALKAARGPIAIPVHGPLMRRY